MEVEVPLGVIDLRLGIKLTKWVKVGDFFSNSDMADLCMVVSSFSR